MPSPFPGMNPYLEHPSLWHDFHERFVSVVAGMLGPQLPPAYRVALSEHLYLRELPDPAPGGQPGQPPAPPARPPAIDRGRPVRPGGAGQAGPVVSRVPDVTVAERLSYIEVRHAATARAVTFVELLSPRNKSPGADRDQYLAERRRRVYTGTTSLVEIDLLRGGARPPLQSWPRCDYAVVVSRAPDRQQVSVWPVGIRDRLPAIPVPLPDPHPHPRIDFQEVLHQAYDEGGFARTAYRNLPDPPLDPADVAWARHHAPRMF